MLGAAVEKYMPVQRSVFTGGKIYACSEVSFF